MPTVKQGLEAGLAAAGRCMTGSAGIPTLICIWCGIWSAGKRWRCCASWTRSSMTAAGTVALEPRTIGWAVAHPGAVRSTHRVAEPGSELAGFRFPPEVISLAVRWYLRFGLSYRHVEALLAERGVEVDHTSVFRWVTWFTPLFVEVARPCRHTPGDRWSVYETYVKVLGRWRYLYRAVDQFGEVIDVLVSPKRDKKAARRFFNRALAGVTAPAEVTTDRARAYPRVLDELLPAAQHVTVAYANNRVEADHGRLKSRRRPMRGLKRDRSLRIVATGHAFVQNLRRGHDELGTEVGTRGRVAAAFTELVLAV